MHVRPSPALVALLAGSLLLAAGPAGAARGVSVDVGRIAIEDRLLPGGGYRLPAISVSNPGDEPTRYRMGVSTIEGQQAEAPPEEWFDFQPSEFTLQPGETRRVRSRIDLPTNAPPADYRALLGASIVSEGEGTQVGAVAAARLSFTVAPSTWLQAWWLRVKRFLVGHAPWTWLLPLIAGGLAAGRMLTRRFTLTVARRA